MDSIKLSWLNVTFFAIFAKLPIYGTNKNTRNVQNKERGIELG